jgi:hypothetical protein
MSWRRFVLGLFLALASAASDASLAVAQPPKVAPHPVSAQARLLALGGDRFLVWGPDGRAELREADGAWSKPLELPLTSVFQAVRDGDSFLIRGGNRTPSTGTFVVRLDAAGHEQRRWTVPDRSGPLTEGRDGPYVAGCNGAIPLRKDGALGPIERFPWDNPFGCCFHPALLPVGDTTVVCRAADLSKQCNAPGSCERPGAGGWRFEGQFLQPPSVCGDWLVARDGNQVVLRSATTGKPVAKKSLTGPSAIACAAPDGLLIAEKRLTMFSLPQLRTVWSTPIAGPSVSDVAVSDHLIAFKTFASGKPAVYVVPRTGR